jgi:hypothetical protein
MNINYIAKHVLRAMWIASRTELYSLTNRHLTHQMMGQYYFTDHRQNVVTPSTCQPPHSGQVSVQHRSWLPHEGAVYRRAPRQPSK